MSFLRNIHYFPIMAKQSEIEQLKKIQQKSFLELRSHYPHLYISASQIKNKIVYMRRFESPEKIVKQGGFKVREKSLWLSHISGNSFSTCQSQGMICLTLLPEITSLFLPSELTSKAYIYALPLMDECVLVGGKWRQVIVPGALPLPPFWRAREVLKINHGHILLGPVIGQGDITDLKKEHGITLEIGERYEAFLHEKGMKTPAPLGVLGEDYLEEYEIEDSPFTETLQLEIQRYYHGLASKKIN